MLDKNDLTTMRNELQQYDEKREQLIKTSREVLKLSKTIIYAVHRSELAKAKKGIYESKVILKKLDAMIKKEGKLAYEGSYRISVQEYVEAVLYYTWVKEQRLATSKELKVESMHYLLGLCDLSGELARRAIHAATDDRYDEIIPIRNLVEEVYQELLTFDIRSGDLRKKFDQIKYDLKRLDDVAFQLKVSGKI